MGDAAPGELPDEANGGGLAKAKPKGSGKKAKWSSENHGLDKPPRGHVGDCATYYDGKDNKTRPSGTFARFQSTYGGTSRSQLHVWCVCDESKSADKQNPCYPGHWKSTQGNPANHNFHKNPGAEGSTFNSFKPRPVQVYKPDGSRKRYGKGAASAATSDTSSTVAEQDLKRAAVHIDHLKNQIRELDIARDAQHLKYAKATELANTQLNLQAQKMIQTTSEHAKALRSSQLNTTKAIANI